MTVLIAKRKSFATLAVGVALSFQAASAETLSISQAECGGPVTLAADDVRLSEVFREMATKMGFELRFTRDSDRQVTLETTQSPEKLIESLSRGENVMVTTVADRRCVNGTRVSAVRFLAAGNTIVVPAHQPHETVSLRQKSVSPAYEVARKNTEDKKPSQRLRRDMTPEERAADREQRRAERGR